VSSQEEMGKCGGNGKINVTWRVYENEPIYGQMETTLKAIKEGRGKKALASVCEEEHSIPLGEEDQGARFLDEEIPQNTAVKRKSGRCQRKGGV